MSDVSGIPYMGPMGMGNFFAPPYGGGGMNMSAGQISSSYMPEIYNNQNTVQNLFNTPGGGGGFGQATNYYSGLGANYAAQGMSPYGVFTDPGYSGGGGGASPYQTTPNVFETGASGYSYPGAGAIDWGGMFGGGGASPYQTSPNVFNSQGMGGGASSFQYPGMGLDWSSLYQAPQSNFSQPNTFDFGAGMFGGLAGGIGGAYQGQNNQMDWSSLFGGGGGAQTDPYPGMAMPGGLGSPMTTQQPNFNTQPSSSAFQQDVFGAGAPPLAGTANAGPAGGGLGMGGLDWGYMSGVPYQSPAAPNQYPMEGAPVTAAFNPYSGGEMTGAGSNAATPSGPRTYDFAPMFEAGGGGFGAGGGDTSGTGDAPAQSFGGNAFSYMPEPSGSRDSFGQPAQALADQARTRLAGLMGGGDAQPVEPSVGPDKAASGTPDLPLSQARPAGPAEPMSPEMQQILSGLAQNAFPGEAGRQGYLGNPAAASPAGAAPEAPGWAAWLNNMGKYMGNPLVSPAGSAEQGASFADRFGAAPASFDERFGSYDPRMDQPLPGNPYTDPQFGAPAGAQPNWGEPTSGVVGPAGSAFGFEPGGFGEGGYGNQFAGAPEAAPPVVAADDPWSKVPLPQATTGGAGAERAARTADAAGPAAASPAAAGEPSVPLPQARPAGADAPRPPGDIPAFPARRLAPNGQEPEAFIVHHTGGRGDPANVVAGWKAERPGVGSQYIMDRNGIVHDTLKEYGYGGTGHIHPDFSGDKSGIPGAQGLKNANIVGMEIVARNDADMTPGQIASLKQFADQNYRDTPFYGHSEVSSNRTNEGIRGSRDILEARPPIFNFDWSNAPIPNPAAGPPMQPPASIPNAGANAPGVQEAVQKMADRYGIPPQSIAANLGLESSWNPRSQLNGNYGLAQINADDFKTGGGRLGGLTFEQYQRATPAQQIGAYSDFINSSPNAAYLDYGSGDPAMVSALLQAMHFSPQDDAWSQRLLAGDTSSRVTPKPQSPELGNTSIDAMRNAFARRIAGAR